MIEKNYYHFNQNNYNDDFILSQNTIIPKNITKYLKNFQLTAIKFLYKNFETHKACILNDESGLGKTVSVAVFLNVILSNNKEKRKCLIICKNEERINNWKFHLDILTGLAFKAAFNENEIDDHTVYLTKWESLRSSASLANFKFDCIIVDNRENLMANKICLAYLLRNYENKISLIIANQDVTIDLKEFHSILRLCGRLETKYRDFKIFEDKFELPLVQGCSSDNQKILESYFLRREKILNYCKEFCLRRFRHQYESHLPLVSPNIYRLNLKKWEDAPLISKIKPVQLNIFSINPSIISNERDTEEMHNSFINKIDHTQTTDGLLNSFFTRKEEDEFNIEVCKITTTITDNAVEQSTEVMSPLVFFPDDSNEKYFDDDKIDEIVSSTTKDENEIRIIHPTPIHINEVSKLSGKTSNLKGNHKDSKGKTGQMETDDDLEIVRITHLTPRTRKDKNSRSGYKKLKISRISTRAQDRVTRSQAHKNKYLTLSIEDTLEKSKRDLEEIKKQKNSCKQKENKNQSNGNKIKSKRSSEKSRENRKSLNRDENFVSTSCDITNSNHLYYPLPFNNNLETTLTSSNSTIDTRRDKTKKIERNQNELQLSGISLLNVQESEAVHVIESTPELIVLSSSSDSSNFFTKEKTTNPFKKAILEKISAKRNKTGSSPDIFGSAMEETMNIICSQKSKHIQNKRVRESKSPADRNTEITEKTTRIRTNSNNITQSNKITKYLKPDSAQDSEKELVSSSSQSLQSSPLLTYLKTPRKKKVIGKIKNDSREGSVTKPSPHSKTTSSTTTPTKTPTALTKWLFKSNVKIPQEGANVVLNKDEEVIPFSRVTRAALKSKRRRLDLSFEKE